MIDMDVEQSVMSLGRWLNRDDGTNKRENGLK